MRRDTIREPGTGPRSWRRVYWPAAAVLLLVPYVAMQFTAEVDWTLSDFVVFGAMLATAGLAFELVSRHRPDRSWRAGAAVSIVAAFLLTWANAAVGLIGSENNPVNDLYYWLPAIVVAGALLSRLRAAGMAWTLAVTGLAQALVPLVAVIAGMAQSEQVLITGVLAAHVVLVLLWLCAAALFLRAARRDRLRF